METIFINDPEEEVPIVHLDRKRAEEHTTPIGERDRLASSLKMEEYRNEILKDKLSIVKRQAEELRRKLAKAERELFAAGKLGLCIADMSVSYEGIEKETLATIKELGVRVAKFGGAWHESKRAAGADEPSEDE